MMTTVQKLRSHSAAVLCCTSSSSTPHTVVSSSEDGSVCYFDLRSNCSTRLEYFGGEAVASVTLNPANSNELYVAAGAVVYVADIRAGSSGGTVLQYAFNEDDINQVVVNQKATYAAAADDTGEIKVIDLHSQKLYKTLRGVHTNICSSVQFLSQKPWEAISGGLDSKIVKWDFSKGKVLRTLDLFASGGRNAGQLYNPPFVHALAVPEGHSSGEAGRLAAVARGDGTVEVYDSCFQDEKISKSGGSKGSKNRRGKNGIHASQDVSWQEESSRAASGENGIRCCLDGEHGGHLSAVSCVTFALFGEKGRYVVSGGNDKLIKLWDWNYSSQNMSHQSDQDSRHALLLDVKHGKKVNWLCTINGNGGNLVVADTSKVLSVYHVL